MQKLLAEGKTDLLTGFVSARTKRKFSAFLVRAARTARSASKFQPRGEKASKRAAPAPGKEFGKHPSDGKPISLKSGRFGPYVQHGKLNATLPKEMNPDVVTLRPSNYWRSRRRPGSAFKSFLLQCTRIRISLVPQSDRRLFTP